MNIPWGSAAQRGEENHASSDLAICYTGIDFCSIWLNACLHFNDLYHSLHLCLCLSHPHTHMHAYAHTHTHKFLYFYPYEDPMLTTHIRHFNCLKSQICFFLTDYVFMKKSLVILLTIFIRHKNILYNITTEYITGTTNTHWATIKPINYTLNNCHNSFEFPAINNEIVINGIDKTVWWWREMQSKMVEQTHIYMYSTCSFIQSSKNSKTDRKGLCPSKRFSQRPVYFSTVCNGTPRIYTMLQTAAAWGGTERCTFCVFSGRQELKKCSTPTKSHEPT